MNQYEFLIDRLREVAKGMDHPQRRTLIQAADALENQRSEIKSLKQICEKQAGLNQRVLDLALELDRTKAEGVSLLKRLEMADAERDIHVQNARGAVLPVEMWQLGTHVFLTREEAEVALANVTDINVGNKGDTE